MKKRVVSLFLACALLIGLLAGCGVGNTPTTTTPTSGPVSGNENQTPEATDGVKELQTVKILCRTDAAATIKIEDWEQYPVSQVLIEKLAERGIKIELECIDKSTFASVVQTRLAAGVDIPDLISYCWIGSDQDTVMGFANNGLLYSVNELLEQYDEDGSIRAFYDEKAPGVWERNTAPDGNVYWFSYLLAKAGEIDRETNDAYTLVLPRTLSIRKDWVEAVGEEVKDVYTPEELAAVVKKMQEQDVNGNGLQDEIMCLSIDGFDFIAQAYGLHSSLLANYYQGDNEVFSNFNHENFPAYIEYMQSLYNDGLITSELLSVSQNELIAQNRAAIVTGYTRATFEGNMAETDPEQSYYYPILVDQDGSLNNGYTILVDSTEATPYCHYFVPKGASNPEAVVRLMDFVYTEEYSILDWYGLEGQGYELDANGNYVDFSGSGDKETFALFDTMLGLYGLPAIGGLFPSVIDRYPADNPIYVQEKHLWTYDFSINTYKAAENVIFTPSALAMATEEETAFVNEKKNVLDTYAVELLTDLILGEKSLDDLQEYLDELDKLGLQDYVAIIQAQRNRIIGK